MTADLDDPALRRQIIATAEAMAEAGGRAALEHFRSPSLSAENKAESGFDPVTAADRAAEAAMRAVLARARPDDAILGEEEGSRPGTSGLTWVIDPIDGTRAFLAGAPTWGILIGVNAGAGPFFGLIDQPWTGERFVGGLGLAELRRNGTSRPLRARPCARLSDAILLSTFPEIGTPQDRAAFDRVKTAARLTRYGLDCYGYALLALGQVDLVIEAGLHPYDVQGPIAVIEAAGGIVTDWTGGPAHDGGRILAAADPRMHRAAMELLAGG